MKLEIDLKEFWLDESDELEPALKKFIIQKAVTTVEKAIEKRIDDHITMKVKAEIEEKMYRFMNLAIEEIIKSEKIKDEAGDRKEVSLTEYIKLHFQRRNSYRNADEVISKEAEKFAKSMKDRYDLLFASQLVAKMSNAGMLKEDVAKILLESPKS